MEPAAACEIIPGAALVIDGGPDAVRARVLRHLTMLEGPDATLTAALNEVFDDVMARVAVCWRGTDNKYYRRDGAPFFDVVNSNQYCQFLLILARAAAQAGHMRFADAVFALNKMMNGCDIYHAVNLPAVFLVNHTTGVVLGRGQYGERFYVSQNCTVGSNSPTQNYAVLGTDNFMMAGATIIGAVRSGDRVIFSAGCYVKDMDVPADTIVFGRGRDVVFKPLTAEILARTSPFIREDMQA